MGIPCWLAAAHLSGRRRICCTSLVMPGTATPEPFSRRWRSMAIWRGELELAASIRIETPGTIVALQRTGVEQIILTSGDTASLTRAISQRIGVDFDFGEQSREDKVNPVIDKRRIGAELMVGDGANDAPALLALDATRRGGARTTPCDGPLRTLRLYAGLVRGAAHEDHLLEFRHDRRSTAPSIRLFVLIS